MSDFIQRHIGPNTQDQSLMLKALDCDSLENLIEKSAPSNILNSQIDLPKALEEHECIDTLKGFAEQNSVFKSFIGMGYYNTHTPGVIQRNILENPAWYTAYTPYQAEIAQGRLEALLNFQTLTSELCALPLSNASLLDEATAAAEAMAMAYSHLRRKKQNFLVSNNCFPQTREVVEHRAKHLDINIIFFDEENIDSSIELDDVFACLFQYPNKKGKAIIPEIFIEKLKKSDVQIIAATDLMALCQLKPPGEWGADICIGSTQRFGVPMGFGGPHAAFISCLEDYKRLIPGRIVGVSIDKLGNRALRLALQTREQHIRRERATSNICTAQVLLAVMASMYAVYHGPKELKKRSKHIIDLTGSFKSTLKDLGYSVDTDFSFGTISLKLDENELKEIKDKTNKQEINFYYPSYDTVMVSFDETHTIQDLKILCKIFADVKNKKFEESGITIQNISLPSNIQRTSAVLSHPIFNKYHSETEMLRYIFRLQNKDLSLVHSMIPLGSCTMKLNATSEMQALTWPEFANIHPFSPPSQTKGYQNLINDLKKKLVNVTGFDDISIQPNAGSQGEFAGLLVIKEYQQSLGESQRNVCIIPSSAHGTNPASAAMAGLKVVVTKCDDNGNIDISDLKEKVAANKDQLCALMITYPSTHGVFESTLSEACDLIHENGGQVYMDGANMNALVGLSQPMKLGVDVSHLNLHKTFCIPHGGGGPGVGPIVVAKHLAPFLPGHGFDKAALSTQIPSVCAAPMGSALILTISWSYIAMMGGDGLKKATEVAILNANYMAKKLNPYFPILYKGQNGMIAHECIVDIRSAKSEYGITADDFAKRLMDFGFHAPTMSWPVIGTLMIEPTESESKLEIDQFCEAMIQIHKEIEQIKSKKWTPEDNPLKNAPHTTKDLVAEWDRSYTKTEAVFPLKWVEEKKFWPSVNRIDNAYGDKNLVCSCPPIEAYE